MHGHLLTYYSIESLIRWTVASNGADVSAVIATNMLLYARQDCFVLVN